ncbi:MAG: hypothetical protein LBT16_13645, partial [Treponema sp.]|nr:hypothetical protein [Treponema sp.]
MDGLSPGLTANYGTSGSYETSGSQEFAKLLDLNRIENLNCQEPRIGAGSNGPGIPPGGINREDEYRLYDGRAPLYSPPPREGAKMEAVSQEGESIGKQSSGETAGETVFRERAEEPGRRAADRNPPGAGRNGKTPNNNGRGTPALAENARERGDAEGVKSGELKSLKENARAKEEEAETE